MRRRDGAFRCAAVVLLAALALASCGGGGKKTTQPRARKTNVAASKTFEASAISNLVLELSDFGRGSGLKTLNAGPLTLDDFWSCCPRQRSVFAEAKFESAYRSAFQVSNLPAEVKSWRAGISFANSSVAIFATAGGASAALPAWLEYFTGSKKGDTTDVALTTGDESKGITGVFFKDDQQMYIYFWRIGNVILHVRIGGRNGTLKQSQLESLVHTVDARAH